MPTITTLPTVMLACLLSGGTAWSADQGGRPNNPPPGGQGQPPPQGPEMDQILHEVFTAADSDANGSLSLTEFTAAMAALKATMTANAPANATALPADTSTDAQKAARLSKAFTAADANGDGMLSFQEFTVAVRMMAPPHRPPPGHQGQQGQQGQSGN